MTQLSLRVLDSWLVPGILVPRGQILGRMDLGGTNRSRSSLGFQAPENATSLDQTIVASPLPWLRRFGVFGQRQ
jgi:hypothetical protein